MSKLIEETNTMNWTTKTPTQDGWYWLKGGDSYGWWEGCVKVDTRDGQYLSEGEWMDLQHVLPNAEWSDRPISEPETKP